MSDAGLTGDWTTMQKRQAKVGMQVTRLPGYGWKRDRRNRLYARSANALAEALVRETGVIEFIGTTEISIRSRFARRSHQSRVTALTVRMANTGQIEVWDNLAEVHPTSAVQAQLVVAQQWEADEQVRDAEQERETARLTRRVADAQVALGQLGLPIVLQLKYRAVSIDLADTVSVDQFVDAVLDINRVIQQQVAGSGTTWNPVVVGVPS